MKGAARPPCAPFVLALSLMGGASGALIGCASSGPHDTTVPSQDERTADAGTIAAQGDYVHIAHRLHGAIGLVGTQGLDLQAAAAFVERLADELEACAVRQEARGLLASGAASLVIAGQPSGAVTLGDLRLAPGGPVAANALECIIAPARALTLPTAASKATRALAIEATWNPRAEGPAQGGVGTDAGAADGDAAPPDAGP